MKSFKLLELDLLIENIHIMSTDPSILSLIQDDISAIFPKCKTHPKELPSGQQYFLFLNNIGDGESVGWMILSKLCSKGWEPFQTEKMNSPYERRIYLKLEVSET